MHLISHLHHIPNTWQVFFACKKKFGFLIELVKESCPQVVAQSAVNYAL
jgi:hypothetical protein